MAADEDEIVLSPSVKGPIRLGNDNDRLLGLVHDASLASQFYMYLRSRSC